jgi:hypothetical protein
MLFVKIVGIRILLAAAPFFALLGGGRSPAMDLGTLGWTLLGCAVIADAALVGLLFSAALQRRFVRK